MGYENIRKKIHSEIGISWGETSADKKFTLLPAQCLGTCDRGPAMMVNDKLYQNLNEEKVELILKSENLEEKDHDKTSHRAHERHWSAP